MDSVMQKLSQKILLPAFILLLFLSYHVYFPSIDRKVLFLFCNVILLLITTHSIVEVDETAKTEASPNYSKIQVIEIEPYLVKENAATATTAAECSVCLVEENATARTVAECSVSRIEPELIFKISEVEADQQRDELQEKIEAFIEKVKRQRRMEVLQDNVKEIFMR